MRVDHDFMIAANSTLVEHQYNYTEEGEIISGLILLGTLIGKAVMAGSLKTLGAAAAKGSTVTVHSLGTQFCSNLLCCFVGEVGKDRMSKSQMDANMRVSLARAGDSLADFIDVHLPGTLNKVGDLQRKVLRNVDELCLMCADACNYGIWKRNWPDREWAMCFSSQQGCPIIDEDELANVSRRTVRHEFYRCVAQIQMMHHVVDQEASDAVVSLQDKVRMLQAKLGGDEENEVKAQVLKKTDRMAKDMYTMLHYEEDAELVSVLSPSELESADATGMVVAMEIAASLQRVKPEENEDLQSYCQRVGGGAASFASRWLASAGPRKLCEGANSLGWFAAMR